MTTTRLVLLVCTMLTVNALAALDLTPSVHEYIAEGITFRQLSFKDGDSKVAYEPPSGWSFTTLAGQLRLTPAKVDGASAVIGSTSAPTPESQTDEGMRSAFLASLPTTVQGLEILGEQVNPLVLDGGVNTYEITATYQIAGQRYVCAMVFANAADKQIVFRLSARKPDFDRLHAAFRSSLLSWRWIEAKSVKDGAVVAATTTTATAN